MIQYRGIVINLCTISLENYCSIFQVSSCLLGYYRHWYFRALRLAIHCCSNSYHAISLNRWSPLSTAPKPNTEFWVGQVRSWHPGIGIPSSWNRDCLVKPNASFLGSSHMVSPPSVAWLAIASRTEHK